MGTKEHRGFVRNRVSKPKNAWTESFRNSKRSSRKSSSAEDNSRRTSRLVKTELDAAELLTEFSRMAHLPSQRVLRQEPEPNQLHWSVKRKRTTRHFMAGASPAVKIEDCEVSQSCKKKNKSDAEMKKGSSPSDRDDMDTETTTTFLDGSKESYQSYQCDSRAESPSSPLPSLGLACSTTVLLGGGSNLKSAFQRVTPLGSDKKTSLLSVKQEVDEMDSKTMLAGRQSVTFRQKPRSRKPSLVVSSIKLESASEQNVNYEAQNPEEKPCIVESGVRLKYLAREHSKPAGANQSCVAIVSKPKTPLTEMEKEARRLRRIQANRESARQTIRRKQILCEELTKKAANLTAENEGMKQKREFLLQELYSLKGQNYHLKQKLGIASSGDIGFESVELLTASSNTVSLPTLQVPTSVPFTGIPLHSFVWAVTVAQATKANQMNILRTSDETPNTSGDSGAKNASPLRSSEQKQDENPDCKSSQKEESCIEVNKVEGKGLPSSPGQAIKEANSVEICKTESEGNTNIPEAGDCKISNSATGQRSSTIGSHRIADLTGAAMTPDNLERYLIPPLAQALTYGFPYGGSAAGVPVKGTIPTPVYSGRKSYVAAVAAAEARRRRKELTRSKFSRIRACRPHPNRNMTL